MSARHSPSPAGTAAPSVSNLSLGAAEQRAANERSSSEQRRQTPQERQAAAPSPRDADMTGSHDDSAERGAMRNRASASNSPYIRAHTSSPVHWQLLDEEAVGLARRENKLIFLNVGFRACHYCRLTSQDSFSNPHVAKLLNSSFVPVMVDREERPDVDAVYMNYIQAVNGDGGWPLNIFLTPELEPVFGGTYWPGPGTELITSGADAVGGAGVSGDEPQERLDFLVVLQKLDVVWREQEARCRKEAGEILLQLREFAAEGTLGARAIGTPSGGAPGISSAAVMGASPATTADMFASIGAAGNPTGAAAAPDLDLDLDQLEEAYAHITGTFDAVNGGFGAPAPKFPTPPKLSFLLRLAEFPSAVADVVGEREVERAREMAFFTLKRIRDGGLRDHVGGGFARYSVTADWAVPHFEKMVADNALLLGVYLDAWLGSRRRGEEGGDEFLDVVLELGDYLTSRPILMEGGGFATSEAADSFYKKGDRHVREGAYYLWTRREFDAVVGAEESAVAAAHWNVLQHGNVPRDLDPQDEFINQNVLCVKKDVGELSRQFGIPVDEVKRVIRSAQGKLLAHREKERVRPETDEKVVAAYNGMVISALARTGRAIREVDGTRAERYVAAAVEAAEFVEQKLWDSQAKVLYRSFHESRSETRAFADDYAFLIEGLLDLAEVTGEEKFIAWADELQKTQLALFYDPPASAPPTPMLHRSSSGGFYSTEESAPFAILRLKDGMDTAQPSTNGVSANNLFRLAALLDDKAYEARAKETVNAFEVEILQYPWLFVSLLAAVVTARLGVSGPVVVKQGEEEPPVLPRAEARVFLKVRLADSEERRWLAERKAGGQSLSVPQLEEGGRGQGVGPASERGAVDVERQCAVVKPDGRPCTASLACKRHSMGAKRAIAGRSAPFDQLLARFLEEKKDEREGAQ